jgi:hypothetical protein
MKDRYAFSDPKNAGDVAPHRGNTIPLDVWRYVIDPETGERTGYLLRERMRTIHEVFQDLYKRLDVVVCDRCEHERPRQPQDCCETHEGCGGEYRWFLDEYFSRDEDQDSLVPHDYRWIACYPVTGSNEGHYIHVAFVVPPDGDVRVRPGELNVRMVRLATGKTFRGMAHAAEIARRCAVFLGA